MALDEFLQGVILGAAVLPIVLLLVALGVRLYTDIKENLK